MTNVITTGSTWLTKTLPITYGTKYVAASGTFINSNNLGSYTIYFKVQSALSKIVFGLNQGNNTWVANIITIGY